MGTNPIGQYGSSASAVSDVPAPPSAGATGGASAATTVAAKPAANSSGARARADNSIQPGTVTGRETRSVSMPHIVRVPVPLINLKMQMRGRDQFRGAPASARAMASCSVAGVNGF